MIRNEVFSNGVCVKAEIVDLDAGTIAIEENGVVVSTRALTEAERTAYAPPPPTDAEMLAAARDALGVLDVIEAPVTAADLADVLVDVKTALGG